MYLDITGKKKPPIQGRQQDVNDREKTSAEGFKERESSSKVE